MVPREWKSNEECHYFPFWNASCDRSLGSDTSSKLGLSEGINITFNKYCPYCHGDQTTTYYQNGKIARKNGELPPNADSLIKNKGLGEYKTCKITPENGPVHGQQKKMVQKGK
jgi:hypothetical protein